MQQVRLDHPGQGKRFAVAAVEPGDPTHERGCTLTLQLGSGHKMAGEWARQAVDDRRDCAPRPVSSIAHMTRMATELEARTEGIAQWTAEHSR